MVQAYHLVFVMQENLSEELIQEISRILLDLTKIVKIVSVYPENNPIPTKLKESFSERFSDLIKDNRGLHFLIQQGEIRFGSQVVYKDNSPEDSLAAIFHNSGITEISFSPPFGYDESNRFFRVMKAFINREKGAGDLVTLFWQENIPGFDYATVEDVILREYDGGMLVQTSMEREETFVRGGADDESGKVIYGRIFLPDDSGEIPLSGDKSSDTGQTAVATGRKKAGGFAFTDMLAEKRMGLSPLPAAKKSPLPDTALILNDAFTLGESERERINEILRSDGESDEFGSTIELIKEINRQETEFQEFNEAVTLVEKLQSEFLQLGNLKAAGELLNYMRELAEVASDERRRERLRRALALAASKESLSGLAEALNQAPDIALEDVENYLNLFGWEVLAAVTDLLGELEHRHHREALCNYLTRTGAEHIDLISRGIFDRRWFVVRNTVSIMAGIGSDRAFSYLEKAINHEEKRVRQEVIKGLARHSNKKAIGLLLKMVWDKDSVVAQEALEAVIARGEEALDAVTSMINDDRFSSLPEGVQENLFIIFSQLGGENAVSYLATLIPRWGLASNQSKQYYMQLAFKALGYNSSEKAEKILLGYSHSWNKRVRYLAKEALVNRRQVKYGGNL